ncbi:MAG: Nif11-like leader peptide family natural product precursor [Oscillospiraceae bacterium]|nr:Nif11-like leader peptide family natural product precursor [Oscillospiraceae bacterium]
MSEEMKKFLEEVSKDADLAEKLDAAETVESVLTLAQEKGFSLCEEDVLAQLPSAELSDEDLDSVTGGAVVLNPLVYKPDGTGRTLSNLLFRKSGDTLSPSDLVWHDGVQKNNRPGSTTI